MWFWQPSSICNHKLLSIPSSTHILILFCSHWISCCTCWLHLLLTGAPGIILSAINENTQFLELLATRLWRTEMNRQGNFAKFCKYFVSGALFIIFVDVWQFCNHMTRVTIFMFTFLGWSWSPRLDLHQTWSHHEGLLLLLTWYLCFNVRPYGLQIPMLDWFKRNSRTTVHLSQGGHWS